MNKQQILDAYFIETRSKLLDVAAFLDRLDRAGGDTDFREQSLRDALTLVTRAEPGRTCAILDHFSDPTEEPVASAPGKGACGAWPGYGRQET